MSKDELNDDVFYECVQDYANELARTNTALTGFVYNLPTRRKNAQGTLIRLIVSFHLSQLIQDALDHVFRTYVETSPQLDGEVKWLDFMDAVLYSVNTLLRSHWVEDKEAFQRSMQRKLDSRNPVAKGPTLLETVSSLGGIDAYQSVTQQIFEKASTELRKYAFVPDRVLGIGAEARMGLVHVAIIVAQTSI